MRRYGHVMTAGALAIALTAVGACNRAETVDSRGNAADQSVARDAEQAAAQQRERDEDIAGLNERVTKLEQEYTEASQRQPRGTSGTTKPLRDEVREDVANARKAVANLATTTPENWWSRHEQAMARTAEDIESDVKRLAGAGYVAPTGTQGTTRVDGEQVSTVPFTSRRDEFVTELRARVDAMKRSLDNVRARGAAETELDDTKARVSKLGDNLDRLKSASADDWWDISKARVDEYIDRVQDSVDRLDDDNG